MKKFLALASAVALALALGGCGSSSDTSTDTATSDPSPTEATAQEASTDAGDTAELDEADLTDGTTYAGTHATCHYKDGTISIVIDDVADDSYSWKCLFDGDEVLAAPTIAADTTGIAVFGFEAIAEGSCHLTFAYLDDGNDGLESGDFLDVDVDVDADGFIAGVTMEEDISF